MDETHDRIKATHDMQKSYADGRKKYLEFQIDEKLFLKVAPTKEVLRFGKKEIETKIRIIRCIRYLVKDMAYKLVLQL